MSYYRTCPLCGAHLDPGEVCECKKETALGATNTGDGKAEQAIDVCTLHTSSDTNTEHHWGPVNPSYRLSKPVGNNPVLAGKEVGTMQFIVETIKFPIKEVRAASIKNRDGSITIYVDEALTGKERNNVIKKLTEGNGQVSKLDTSTGADGYL